MPISRMLTSKETIKIVQEVLSGEDGTYDIIISMDEKHPNLNIKDIIIVNTNREE